VRQIDDNASSRSTSKYESRAIMNISDFLAPQHVLIDIRTKQKGALLRELAQIASSALAMSVDVISSELLKREELGSTGVGGGVALPHARVQDVKQPFGILAKLKHPLDFDAIDGQPIDIAFLVLLPSPAESSQLVALALVARKLKMPEMLMRLRGAKSASELYAVIVG
jgi:PTS system nitrogen regulatory IIA component